jgi:hypothetical protein
VNDDDWSFLLSYAETGIAHAAVSEAARHRAEITMLRFRQWLLEQGIVP